MLAKTNAWQYVSSERALPVATPKERQQRKLGIKGRLLLGVMPLMMLFAIPYFVNIFIEHKGYEVQQIRTRIVQMNKENEVLRLEVGQLKAPGRIQRIAETELGMFIPSQALYGGGGAKRVAAKVGASAEAIRN